MKALICAWLSLAAMLVCNVSVRAENEDCRASAPVNDHQNIDRQNQTMALGYRERRKRLGRNEKLRIMVDKVACCDNPQERMTAQHVKFYADAGFNVVVPRSGAHDFDYVRQIAGLARENDVFYMPWIRGATSTPERDPQTGLPVPERQKIVWNNGVVQDKYSPNSDQFWDWFYERVLTYAKISIDEPSLIGVFLDFENYQLPDGAHWALYELSFDETIMEGFAAAKDVPLPELEPDQRAAWLMEQGWYDAFKEFQFAHWRNRCWKLRKAVDAINPSFQFCIYRCEGAFISAAAWCEWATPEAPLIVADHHTYGRPSGPFLNALEHSVQELREQRQKVLVYARQHNVPLMMIGGIDPISYPFIDHEFAGKNAVAISENCDGYWVFYELDGVPRSRAAVRDWPVHTGYIDWFARGNRAIEKEQFAFWHEARETPEVAGQN